MIQFLPKNLDLQKLLSENPPDFKYHIDHFSYILGLVYSLPSKNKDTMREGGYVPLHAHLLKKVNNSYKRYINYLIKYGVIECDNHYIVGEKSKCYRFAPKYHDIIQPVYITKYTLTKNLKQVQRSNRWALSKYEYLYRWIDGLSVDFTKAEQKLLEIYQHDLDAGELNALHKLNSNLVNLIKLQKKEHVFTVDTTSFRLHTLLTRIKKDLRQFISYNDIQLANIDFRNSQFTIGLSLLENSFYNRDPKQERVSIYNIDPQLAELLPIKTIADYVNANQSEYSEGKGARIPGQRVPPIPEQRVPL